MKSQTCLEDLLKAASGKGLRTFADILAASSLQDDLWEFFEAVEKDMLIMSKVWEPGTDVSKNTWVRGADFKEFYQNGWDKNWYHDDAEIPCEGDCGEWLLEDNELYPIEKLGFSVWQGSPDDMKKFEMYPVWHQFRDWARHQLSTEDLPENPGV